MFLLHVLCTGMQSLSGLQVELSLKANAFSHLFIVMMCHILRHLLITLKHCSLVWKGSPSKVMYGPH